MVISLKNIYDFPGGKVSFEGEVSEERLKEVRGYNFEGPAEVKGEATNRAGAVILRYSVGFSVKTECDRCFEPIVRRFSADFEHMPVRESEMPDNGDYIPVGDGDIIDMDELAVSDILLSIPSRILCSEDCRGICFGCRVNLNHAQCECGAD